MVIENEKYVLLNEGIKALKNGDLNIITLVGEPGEGKTFNTLKYLKENGLNYCYINSYVTPLSFYKLLYEKRKKDVIIFDDLHGANNPLVLEMLKDACWISDGKRVVSYYSTTSKLNTDEIPSSFEANFKVILISNKLIKDYSPITNRGLTIKFNFNFKEKLKLFEELRKDANIEEEVLKYIKTNCSEATNNLSMRTLVTLSKLKRSNQNFKLFAKEMLTIDEDKELILKMTAKEWSNATGHHKRTYYKKKKKLNESN